MARQKSEVRVISVEPVNTNDSKHILTYEESQSSKTVIDPEEKRMSYRDVLINSIKEGTIGRPGNIITVKPVSQGHDEDSFKQTEDMSQPKRDVTKDRMDHPTAMTSGSEEAQCNMIGDKKDEKKKKKKKNKDSIKQTVDMSQPKRDVKVTKDRMDHPTATTSGSKEAQCNMIGDKKDEKKKKKKKNKDSIKQTEDMSQPKRDVKVTKDRMDHPTATTSGFKESQCNMIGDKKDEKKKKKKNKKKEQSLANDSGKEKAKDEGHGRKSTGGAVGTQHTDDTRTSPENAQTDAAAEEPKKKEKKSKLPCCFGFISTWIAKRKENRREKKRKAIEARKSKTPVDTLVEYEHKQAKGGVAFTIEVDSRPIRRPVLPPIPQRPGPIMLGTDERLQNAEVKRAEQLEKKKKPSQEHSKKRDECINRKEESEFDFKKKAYLTIRYRQADAERKRKRFQDEQRPKSSLLLRAPSTLPPLEKVYKNPSAAANMDESQANARDHGPVDEFFDF